MLGSLQKAQGHTGCVKNIGTEDMRIERIPKFLRRHYN